MNRHGEDMAGLQVGRAMQEAWPGLAIIYLAALWRFSCVDAHFWSVKDFSASQLP
jgi:hypothetical protein